MKGGTIITTSDLSIGWATRGVMISTSVFPSLPPMLECGFESRFGLEFLGFSMWHFFLARRQGVSQGTLVSSPPSSVKSFSQCNKLD